MVIFNEVCESIVRIPPQDGQAASNSRSLSPNRWFAVPFFGFVSVFV